MRTVVRFIPSALMLLLGLSLGADRAAAQAMISYGHGVAKAAGAGAAVGAGVGGVLTGLGNPLATSADRSGSTNRNRAAVQRQTVPTRRGDVRWDVPQAGFGAPAPLGLVGGVKATGVADTNWQPSLLAPSQNLAVISANWGGSSETETAVEKADASVEQAPAGSGDEAVAEKQSNLPTVLRSTAHGAFPGGKSAQQADAAVAPTPELPEGVAVGAPVDLLIQKLGRPHLSFRGVAGQGYTDEYVFGLPGGAKLIAYALDGVVAHLAVD
jgi:hypothetical protein